MINLKSDVAALSGKIVSQTNTVFNLTHHVDALQQIVSHLLQTGNQNSWLNPNHNFIVLHLFTDGPGYTHLLTLFK